MAISTSWRRFEFMVVLIICGLLAVVAAPSVQAGASTLDGLTPAIIGDSPSAKVTRLYLAFFERSPSVSDRVYWVNELNNGKPLVDAADFFAASDEFASNYGSLDNEGFVDLIYRNVLRRGRSSGEQFWIDELTSGRRTRGGVMIGFSESPEFSSVLLANFDDSSVFRLYCAYFLRPPDSPGREFWKERQAGGTPLSEIAQQFASSPEFISLYGQLSNPAFVSLIYQNILNRAPEASGFDYWTSELASAGATRGEVVTAFSESAEYVGQFPAQGCPSRSYLPPTATSVIFESDFSQDSGYAVGQTNLWNGGSSIPVDPPVGWDGVKVIGNGSIVVESGEGIAGGNALKLSWDPQMVQPVLSLGKHLTGDLTTGFDEVFIRYQVRFPNNFRIGEAAAGIEHWKWGRLWQNTSTGPGGPNGWSENRPNSHYVVWNFGGNIPYTDVNVTWGENTGAGRQLGSAGGPRQNVDFFRTGSDQHSSPGYFESLWPINDSERPGTLEDNTSQGWHTVEFRFKLATNPTSDDGEFEMWWDGISQGPYAQIGSGGGAPTRSGIPTARMGSGFNFLTFFDNLYGWNSDWALPGVDGFIYVNDVVVSTGPIGPSYVAGS